MAFWNRDKKPKTRMKVTIQIKTPKGQATGTAKKLERLLLGIKIPDYENREVNADDSLITWTLITTLSHVLAINKRVALYETLVTQTLKELGGKQKGGVKKWAYKKMGFTQVTPKQKAELKEMLEGNTSVKIIEKKVIKDGEKWE